VKEEMEGEGERPGARGESSSENSEIASWEKSEA